MEDCFRPLLETREPDRALRPEPERIPTLCLEPPPESWPDPEAFLPDD
jgi:hypothetical protein